MADSTVSAVLVRLGYGQEVSGGLEDRTSDNNNTTEDFRILETALLRGSEDNGGSDDWSYAIQQAEYYAGGADEA